MSRGLGRAEQTLIGYMTSPRNRDRAIRLDVVASITGLHRESARRAFRSLARKGIAELGCDTGWRVYETKDGAEVMKFYETASPTIQLSAEYLSALKEHNENGAQS